ncbi:MAG: thiamine-binding protein [Candidatus Kapaibacterium sp.]
MRISVDISYYPLKEEYKETIKAFIARIKKDPEIEAVTNSMSTQLRGEHDKIMPLLTDEMTNVFQEHRAAFVLKIIKGSD